MLKIIDWVLNKGSSTHKTRANRTDCTIYEVYICWLVKYSDLLYRVCCINNDKCELFSG